MRKRILSLLLSLAAAVCLASPGALADGGTASPEPAQTAPAVSNTASPEPTQSPSDGWVEKAGGVYYLAGGKPVTGWQTIDRVRYYFLTNGRRASGWTGIKGKRYYFGEAGLAYTGLHYVREDGKMYLFSQKGVLQTSGPVSVYGRQYDLGPGGELLGYLANSSGMAAAVLDEIGWDLRAAFDWAAALTYYGKDTRAPDDAVHSDWYATYGFSYLCGNCYVMAATFYQMARLLGCEVYYIEGGVGSYNGQVVDHSWTELAVDGEICVFDPAFTNEEHVDGFQIQYTQPGTWYYFDPVRVP